MKKKRAEHMKIISGVLLVLRCELRFFVEMLHGLGYNTNMLLSVNRRHQREDRPMSVSYNKLWKLMIDKNINKTRLREEAGISSNAMAKLGRNESVRVDVLVKICNHLGCTMDDIMEIIPDEAGESHA